MVQQKVILLYIYKKIKTNNYRQNTDEDSNNLSVTSINNCETSENVLRTTETPNNDTLNDDLAAPTPKKNFQPTPHHSNSVQLKTNLIKEKIPLQ